MTKPVVNRFLPGSARLVYSCGPVTVENADCASDPHMTLPCSLAMKMSNGSLEPRKTCGNPAALSPSSSGYSVPGPQPMFAVDAPNDTTGRSTRIVLSPGSSCEYGELPNRCGR